MNKQNKNTAKRETKKQIALANLIEKITPICATKGAHLQHSHDYIIVAYRRFKLEGVRLTKTMQDTMNYIAEFVDGFIPLINGNVIRNPADTNEAKQLKAFLDLHGLKAYKVGFKLFINGEPVDKTLDLTDIIEKSKVS